ncbi:Pycsar system effector family protein [Alicyclobacillus sacchari]|nr:Pycsar system effector family protein [Alicyclobacillus sacchari]
MPKGDEAMKEELKYLFDKVNDWLKFAEAKHIALITFDTAALFGLISLLTNSSVSATIKVPIATFVVGIGLSVLISLFSFSSITNSNKFFRRKAGPAQHDNLLFFGHISKYEESQYKEALQNQFNCQLNEWEGQLADQIVVNSKIVMRKFRLFNWSVWTVLVFVGISALFWFWG